MKALIVTIAAAMMALNVAAHNPGIDPDNYCAKSKNGQTVVEFNGSTIKKEIKFKDGSRLKPNGTVVLTSGKTVKLKEGECVNENNITSLSSHKPQSIGEQKDFEKDQKNIKNESKTDTTGLYPEKRDKIRNSDSTMYPDKKGKNKDSDEEPK